MSRLTLIGLVAFMGLGLGACHSGGQPGQDMPPDPGGMGGGPDEPHVPSPIRAGQIARGSSMSRAILHSHVRSRRVALI